MGYRHTYVHTFIYMFVYTCMLQLKTTTKTYLRGTISSILYRPGQVQYLPNTALLPIPTCAERDQTAPKWFSDVCCHGQFCMDLHSDVLKAECKPAKLTGVQQKLQRVYRDHGSACKSLQIPDAFS